MKAHRQPCHAEVDALTRLPAETVREGSVPHDWDFSGVPDEEMVACCYWEYARESAFLRNLRRRCFQKRCQGGPRDERLSADLKQLHSLGPPAEALARGFHLGPGEAGAYDPQDPARLPNSFPAPWQTLSGRERAFRVRTLLSAGWTPAAPFERADWHDAREIAKQAEVRWQAVFPSMTA